MAAGKKLCPAKYNFRTPFLQSVSFIGVLLLPLWLVVLHEKTLSRNIEMETRERLARLMVKKWIWDSILGNDAKEWGSLVIL